MQNHLDKSTLAPDMFLMYLRKSRQDNPDETIEEVLSKHETILQEYMQREYGFRVPPENTFREVCSGESIDDREGIKKVLAKTEKADIVGVVVVEPQRLSRGDLIDCGNLIQHLRYTKTLVITPVMTYNLENKMERKFFQDELLRGNDYLEYTKEILFRGRVAAPPLLLSDGLLHPSLLRKCAFDLHCDRSPLSGHRLLPFSGCFFPECAAVWPCRSKIGCRLAHR